MADRDKISDDDIGAPVVDTEGTQVGTVIDVGSETVQIQPESEVDDDALARASLGWDNAEETYPVDIAAMARIETADGVSFRIDLAELQGGEATDEHVATGGLDTDEPEPSDES